MTTQSKEQLMDEMVELAERCEKATGRQTDGGYALDRDIAKAIGWTYRLRDGTNTFQWYAPGAGDEYGNGGERRVSAPPFSTSLDAAMTLVPEARGWNLHRYQSGRARCCVYHDDGRDPGHTCNAATPALALCAASLRARAASEAGNG